MLKPQLGVQNVLGDLVAQFFQRGEFTLVPQFLDKHDYQFLSVEIAGEVEEMGFDAELRCGIPQGGAVAEIQHGAVAFAADLGMNRIDAGRR
jgi:hypothetical protein